MRRLRQTPLQSPRGLSDFPRRRRIIGKSRERVGNIRSDLFGALHEEPPFGERLFLALLRRELRKLGVRMAQIVGVGARLGDARVFFRQRASRRLPRAIARAHVIRLRDKAAMRVDERAMRIRIDERAFVVLTMDLDEFAPDGAQRLRRRRLVIHKGAGAAVRRLHAAQHQLVLARQSEFARRKMRGMIRRRIERRRHLALFAAGAHERRVAPPAERQHEGVEQNRFSRAGLSRQRRQARREFQVERVDQHDVANGKTDQHEALLKCPGRAHAPEAARRRRADGPRL